MSMGEPKMAENEQSKLGTLSNVENVVNEYAKVVCKKYRVREGDFRVNLVGRMKRGDMTIRPGPVVQIDLLWPDTQPVINQKLHSAFELICRRGLKTPLSIEKVAVIQARKKTHKKWLREKFGDEADILPDLLGNHRVVYETVTIVTARDIVTGESVTITSKDEHFRTEWEAQQISRTKLSRIVRDKYVSDDDNVVESETPELDTAITNGSCEARELSIHEIDHELGVAGLEQIVERNSYDN